jgi:microcystin-dependent protein
MTLYKWSQTSASDATADSTINWQEGQAPSSVNDSARAMMAATAKYRDDISGAIVTSGSSTAYTVSSYQIFDTLAHLSGQMIAFTPHTTNGPTVTLAVDGLGAKPLRTSPGVELLAGTIIQGTPYVAVYNNSDGAFYLRGFYGNPYNIPLAAGLPYFAASTPNSSFAFPFGQAVSRTTYSALFVILSTNFGVGDGSTTFNLPDMRGRVPAGWDAMGGVAANRLTAASGFGGLFTVAGAETRALVTANLPPYTPAGSIANGAITVSGNASFVEGGNGLAAGNGSQVLGATITPSQAASSFTGTAQGGTSTPVITVMPAMEVNYIMRII